MGVVTKYFDVTKLPDEIKKPVIGVAEAYGIPVESVNFVRKGLEVYKQPDFNDNEKSVIAYISTGAMDRDKEIVVPGGIDLTHYEKYPVVMFGHDYKKLPIGRAAWIKNDSMNRGLIAKILYANTPEASLIYNYRKDGFPLAESVGFVPLKYISCNEKHRKEEFTREVENAVQRGWVTPGDAKQVRSIIQKWSLLEFSDVSIPCNPEALTVAVNKGLISKEQIEEEGSLVQIQELKPCIINKEDGEGKNKTIIQVDGLKEDKEIAKVEEEKKVEVKTNEPPPLSPVTNESSDVQKKRLDIKGNPSIRDIMNALDDETMKMMQKEAEMGMNTYRYVEDLYPVNYPDGNCVCVCRGSDGVRKYMEHPYTYDPVTKLAVMGEGKECELGYRPKKVEGTKEFSLEGVKLLDTLPVIEKAGWVEEGKKYYVVDTMFGAKVLVVPHVDVKKVEEVDAYKNTRISLAQKCFSNLRSVEPKGKEDWEKLYTKWSDFFLSCLPGKENILEFCKGEGLTYKGISVEEVKVEKKEEELTKEDVVRLIAGAVEESNKSTSVLLQESLAKLLGRAQM